VPPTASTAVFDTRFVRHLWRLTRVYWTSPAARHGALLLALCIAGELGTVYGNVMIATAQGRVFDAVQNKEAPAFFSAMEIFFAVALLVVLVSTYRIYVRGLLQIHWREHLTAHFLGEWIGPHAYAQRERHHRKTDNPDQRIAEDIQTYVASALGLSLSLLSAIATLISFASLLWTLSGRWPLRIGDHEYWIPGLMMWVAILYSIVSMYLTHRVGRSLVGINFDRLRYEADFRYGLVRFRDHIEAVAVSRGEAMERACALRRFRNVAQNWWQLIAKQRNLTLLTSGIGQANGVVPLLVAAPAFFAGRMTLGAVTETGIAYGQVSGALSWFVDAYQEIAAWRASIERLAVFSEVVDTARAELEEAAGVHVETGDTAALRLVDVDLSLPDGREVLRDVTGAVAAGERVALVGPAGVGKTVLFRALAGIWPFGSGRIEMPAQARSLFLPQQPYVPLGTLREAVTYPAAADAFPDDKVRDALQVLGLEPLVGHLDDTEQWDQQLSGDEQHRLAFARALLHQPDWLFMDDATAGLDERMEQRVYEVLAQRLPTATLLSMTNRPGVARFHQRRWELVAEQNRQAVLQTA
jgi:putative ATP-binding cassette transporter